MRKTVSIARVAVKNMFSGMISEKGGRIQKGLLIVLAVSLLPIGTLVWAYTGEMYGLLSALNMHTHIPAIAVGLVSAGIFALGFMFIISGLYYAKDVRPLLYVPVTCTQALLGRFVPLMLYEYMVSAVLLLPALVRYGVSSGAGIGYYFIAAAVFVLVPVVPLAMTCMIIMPLMRFTSLFRNKDLIAKVTGVIVLAAVIFFSLRTGGNEDPTGLTSEAFAGVVEGVVNRIFVSAPLAGAALGAPDVTGRLLGLAGFLAAALVALGLYLLFGRLFYFKGLAAVASYGGRASRLTETELVRGLSRSSAVASVARRELRLLFRSPTYFLNNIISSLILPVMLLVPMLSGGGELQDMLGTALPDSLRPGDSEYTVIYCVGLGICAFLSAVNSISASAVSREGSCFYILKLIPVPFRLVAVGKMLPGLIFGLAPSALALVVAALVLKIPCGCCLCIFVALLFLCPFINIAGLLIDMRFPKLNWQDEAKAVKQNYNVVLCMLVAVAAAALPAVIVLLTESFYILFMASIVLYVLMTVIAWRLLCAGEKAFFERLS